LQGFARKVVDDHGKSHSDAAEESNSQLLVYKHLNWYGVLLIITPLFIYFCLSIM